MTDDEQKAPEPVDPEPDSEARSPDGVDAARRRLLRAMVYAAPVVVSTVVVKPAHAQAASCGPTACPPTGPPCSPQGCPPTMGGGL
jgi:hypothetical protein